MDDGIRKFVQEQLAKGHTPSTVLSRAVYFFGVTRTAKIKRVIAEETK